MRLLTVAAGSLVLLVGWVVRELGTAHPLVDLRLLCHRSVLAANATMLSLVVWFVRTPASANYGFGASVMVAGLMLVPFSLASFAASKVVEDR